MRQERPGPGGFGPTARGATAGVIEPRGRHAVSSTPRIRAAAGAVLVTLAGGIVSLLAALGDDRPGGAPPAGTVVEPGEREEAAPVEPTDVALELRLAGAEVDRSDPAGSATALVRFCFHRPLHTVAAPARLLVQGADPDIVVAAGHAEISDDASSCLVATFDGAVDLAGFTVATALDGAVVDAGGRANPVSSAPLSGGAAGGGPGRTTGPDLADATPRPTRREVVYRFDEPLDEQSADPKRFGFHIPVGAAVTADRVVSVDRTEVIVQFADDVEGGVGDAARFFVLGGAVHDRADTANPPAALGVDTARPDLAGGRPVDGASNQWEFVFDEPVASVRRSRLLVVTDDARVHRAASVSRPAPDVVRATFAPRVARSHSVVLGATLPAAVRAIDAAGSPGTVGTVVLGSADVSEGRTVGPDLVATHFDDATGEVVYVFDEHLDDRNPLLASDFHVVTVGGAVREARAVLEVRREQVVAAFHADAVVAAVAATADLHAVRDEQGKGSSAALSLRQGAA
jgi:hypothetical protein